MSLFSEVFPDFPLPKPSKEQMVLYCFFPYPPLQEKPYVVKIGEKSYSNLNDEQRTKMKDKLEKKLAWMEGEELLSVLKKVVEEQLHFMKTEVGKGEPEQY